MKRYKSLKQRFQELQLKDLTKNQGISNMTLRFKKERNKIMGSETYVSKLIECNLLDNGDVDFIFLSEATDKYPPDFKYKDAPIDKGYKLEPNLSKTYTITIRIKNVLEWLSTYPDKTEITPKDIKDILDVSDIEIDSDVPMFYWQGAAYYLQQLDATIYKKSIIAPKFWNQDKYHGDGNAFVDKITQSILNQIAFFRNLMGSMLTKRLRDKGYL